MTFEISVEEIDAIEAQRIVPDLVLSPRKANVTFGQTQAQVQPEAQTLMFELSSERGSSSHGKNVNHNNRVIAVDFVSTSTAGDNERITVHRDRHCFQLLTR